MSVYMLCERALKLIGANSLKEMGQWRVELLEDLNYDGLVEAHAPPEASLCALHFPSVRDGLFHTYPWEFARKNERLTDKSSAVVFGWAHTYDLPSDCMKLHQLVLRHGTLPKFELLGALVACDYEEVAARYTARIDDLSKWPMLFQDALCERLAFEISTSLNGISGESLLQVFQMTISEGYRTGIIDSSVQPNAMGYQGDSGGVAVEQTLTRRQELNLSGMPAQSNGG